VGQDQSIDEEQPVPFTEIQILGSHPCCTTDCTQAHLLVSLQLTAPTVEDPDPSLASFSVSNLLP
jgi:hypothetical protein